MGAEMTPPRLPCQIMSVRQTTTGSFGVLRPSVRAVAGITGKLATRTRCILSVSRAVRRMCMTIDLLHRQRRFADSAGNTRSWPRRPR